MAYTFEQIRIHFIQHAVQQVWCEGNAASAILESLRQELQEELSAEEDLHLRENVNYLCTEAEKLLRGRIPHTIASSNVAIELWGYEQIQPLTPDIYIHYNQPSQTDLDLQFQLPEHEVWVWNVVYTSTGTYYGKQIASSGDFATQSRDLGPVQFVLQTAEVLKNFEGFEPLADLTAENMDGFTLEFDECRAMAETLQSHRSEMAQALVPLIQGEDNLDHAKGLLDLWGAPLWAALNQGIAQFKRGKVIR